MVRKNSLATLILLLTTCVSTAFSLPVDTNIARRVAQNFLYAKGVKDTQSLSLQTLPVGSIYAYRGSQAFALIAADDAARPVLAYSTTNTMGADALNNRCGILATLMGYAEQISLLAKHDAVADSATHAEWQHWLQGGAGSRSAKGSFCEPLIATQWGQGDPYNKKCPYIEQSQTHAVAGCLAIAVAQILRYWCYPERGISSHCYDYKTYTNICADFANTTYDWAHMPQQLSIGSSAREQDAVSTLIYHCGVAVDMHYNTVDGDGSSSTMDDAEEGLAEFFGYPANYYTDCRNDGYTDELWFAKVKDELDAKRPLLYIGTGEKSGGHAFVCDGYDTDDRLHINWGWCGMYDGYFAVGALNPGGSGIGGGGQNSFNDNNYMLFNLAPPDQLRLSQQQISVSENADSAYVTTFASSSSEEWSATTTTPWIEVLTPTGRGLRNSDSLRFRTDTNYSGHQRSGTIAVRQGTQTATLTVNQISCGLLEIGDEGFEEGFEEATAGCWQATATAGADNGDYGTKTADADYVYGGSHSFVFAANQAAGGMQSLTSPRLTLASSMKLSLYYKRVMSYNEQFDVLYSTTTNDSAAFIYLLGRATATQKGWHLFEAMLPANAQYITLRYRNRGYNNARQLLIDNITFTPADMQCDAISTLPFVEDFEGDLQCWTATADEQTNKMGLTRQYETLTDSSAFLFSSQSSANSYNQYLITPRIELADSFELTFKYKKDGVKKELLAISYSTTGNTLDCFSHSADSIGVFGMTWNTYTAMLPPEARYIMINYYTTARKFVLIDDLELRSTGGSEGIQLPIVCPISCTLVDGQLHLGNLGGQSVRIYNMLGQPVYQCHGTDAATLRLPSIGVYIIQTPRQRLKILNR